MCEVFFFAFLLGRSLRRKSKEDPDREARPETHLDEDEDGKKAKSLLSKWAVLHSPGLAEMVLGRGLGAAPAPQYSGRFPWSPLGVGCHCTLEPVNSASLPAPLSPKFSS